MRGWLGKAKSVLKRRHSEPVPFEVTSAAGCVVEGLRTRGHQVVTCPATGERLFVLPLDVYPDAADRRKKKDAGKRRGQPAGRSEKRRPDRSEREAAKGERRRRLKQAAKAGPDNARRRVARAWTATRSGAGAARRWFTPLRATVAAMGAVVLLTSLFVLRSRSREQAEIVLRTATAKAWEAVDDRRFREASEAFAEADTALGVLGLEDPSLERAAREVEIALELTEFPLVDLLADADRYDERHRSHWIVVDAAADRFTTVEGESVLRVEYPLEIDGVPIDLFVDEEAFSGLDVPESRSGDTRRVVFAARLGDFRRSGDEFTPSILRLDEPLPWVHARTLPAAGLVVDDATRKVLDAQAEAAGVALSPVDAVPDEEPE